MSQQLYDQVLSITKMKRIFDDYCLISLGKISSAFSFIPGQFVTIKPLKYSPGLLRKPFGILCTNNGDLDLLIKIVGKNTAFFSQLSLGDQIKVLGPLGNGFGSFSKKNILVAGGIGIVPLYALLCDYFKSQSIDSNPPQLKLLYGAGSASHLPLLHEIEQLGLSCTVCTDDGSHGEQGLVTHLLAKVLEEDSSTSVKIFGCGPKPMLEALGNTVKKKRLTAELSLEEYMGCGTGVCMGCAVKCTAANSDGYVYKRVCKEGPVFNANEIIWK